MRLTSLPPPSPCHRRCIRQQPDHTNGILHRVTVRTPTLTTYRTQAHHTSLSTQLAILTPRTLHHSCLRIASALSALIITTQSSTATTITVRVRTHHHDTIITIAHPNMKLIDASALAAENVFRSTHNLHRINRHAGETLPRRRHIALRHR